MRSPENSSEAPAPQASVKPDTSKQGGKYRALTCHIPSHLAQPSAIRRNSQLLGFSGGGEMEDWNVYVCNVQTFQGLLEELVSVLPESKHVTGKHANLVAAAKKREGLSCHPLTCHCPSPPPQHRASGRNLQIVACPWGEKEWKCPFNAPPVQRASKRTAFWYTCFKAQMEPYVL